jgi:hypothetical protein
MQCGLLQGYFIGRPVVATALPAELSRIAADCIAPALTLNAYEETRP